jgi:hypothetical protein
LTEKRRNDGISVPKYDSKNGISVKNYHQNDGISVNSLVDSIKYIIFAPDKNIEKCWNANILNVWNTSCEKKPTRSF